MVVLACLKPDCDYSTEDVKEQTAMSLLERHSTSHGDNSDWPPPEAGFTELYVAVREGSHIKKTCDRCLPGFTLSPNHGITSIY